jgi:hypothetical protein
MAFDSIIWDPDGNVPHCAEHGLTKEEVEEVFQNGDGGGNDHETHHP